MLYDMQRLGGFLLTKQEMERLGYDHCKRNESLKSQFGGLLRFTFSLALLSFPKCQFQNNSNYEDEL
jgi:hypothetical protein